MRHCGGGEQDENDFLFLTASISASIAMAISCGVCAPISKPMGA